MGFYLGFPDVVFFTSDGDFGFFYPRFVLEIEDCLSIPCMGSACGNSSLGFDVVINGRVHVFPLMNENGILLKAILLAELELLCSTRATDCSLVQDLFDGMLERETKSFVSVLGPLNWRHLDLQSDLLMEMSLVLIFRLMGILTHLCDVHFSGLDSVMEAVTQLVFLEEHGGGEVMKLVAFVNDDLVWGYLPMHIDGGEIPFLVLKGVISSVLNSNEVDRCGLFFVGRKIRNAWFVFDNMSQQILIWDVERSSIDGSPRGSMNLVSVRESIWVSPRPLVFNVHLRLTHGWDSKLLKADMGTNFDKGFHWKILVSITINIVGFLWINDADLLQLMGNLEDSQENFRLVEGPIWVICDHGFVQGKWSLVLDKEQCRWGPSKWPVLTNVFYLERVYQELVALVELVAKTKDTILISTLDEDLLDSVLIKYAIVRKGCVLNNLYVVFRLLRMTTMQSFLRHFVSTMFVEGKGNVYAGDIDVDLISMRPMLASYVDRCPENGLGLTQAWNAGCRIVICITVKSGLVHVKNGIRMDIIAAWGSLESIEVSIMLFVPFIWAVTEACGGTAYLLSCNLVRIKLMVT